MKVLKILLTIIICSMCFSVCDTVYAEDDYGYTEDEKEAAKAWLSAHGYPPTRAGAEMAYQDYLNGKFDDDPEVQKYKNNNEGETTEDSEGNSEGEEKTSEEDKTEESTSTKEGENEDVKRASGVEVVTDKKFADSLEEDVNDKLDNPSLKMDNPSEVELVANTSKDMNKEKDLSDVLLLAGVIAAVGLILFAVKAGGNKRQNNDDTDI